jgi:flagellar basal body-associated protein FliL
MTDVEQQEGGDSTAPQPRSSNFKAILGAIIIFMVVVVGGFALMGTQSDETQPDVPTSQETVTPTVQRPSQTTVISDPVLAGGRMQAIRSYAKQIQKTIIERKFLVMIVSIVVVLAIAGAITGAVLYYQRQQQQLAERAIKEAEEAEARRLNDERTRSSTTIHETHPPKSMSPLRIALIVTIVIIICAISGIAAYKKFMKRKGGNPCDDISKYKTMRSGPVDRQNLLSPY